MGPMLGSTSTVLDSSDGEKKLRTSNIEFKLPKPSYTIDTLTYLKDKYAQHEFSIIMGSDSFVNNLSNEGKEWTYYLENDYKSF